MEHSKLKIAILGTRGIPASYGGFETFAEELATRLVARGHDVTVYGRKGVYDSAPSDGMYKGVRLRNLPAIKHKYLETPLHAFISMLDLWWLRHDVALLCNAANSPFSWLLNLRNLPFAINVDGIERQRAKWNSLGKLWYRVGEFCSVLFADKVVADARVISDYYSQTYKVCPEIIAYGASVKKIPPGETLSRFGLEAGNYILYVSRLEPENNALGVIQAHRRLNTDIPLVIVGDAPYAEGYKRKLKEAAGANVIFTGFQFGDAYRELRTSCRLYIQATEVGGTHPALVEGMAYGNCIIANSTPENCEVLGDAGVYYPKNDFTVLSQKMDFLIRDHAAAAGYGKKAETRARELYTWDRITAEYENLFITLMETNDTGY